MVIFVGFDVIVIDFWIVFVMEDWFLNGLFKVEWLEDVFKEVFFDFYMVVVVVIYDFKIDDFLLIEVLKIRCFYVGVFGSWKIYGIWLD